MEFIKTKNGYNNEMTVVFDGDYYFIEAFHGLVAVARRQRTDDPHVLDEHFKVELTAAISETKIKRVINARESHYIEVHPTYEFEYRKYRDTGVICTDSLPYAINISLTKL